MPRARARLMINRMCLAHLSFTHVLYAGLGCIAYIFYIIATASVIVCL